MLTKGIEYDSLNRLHPQWENPKLIVMYYYYFSRITARCGKVGLVKLD
jgi:hypothetical protein